MQGQSSRPLPAPGTQAVNVDASPSLELREVLAVVVGDRALGALPVRAFLVNGKWAAPGNSAFIIDDPGTTMGLRVNKKSGTLLEKLEPIDMDLERMRALVAEACRVAPARNRRKMLLAIVRGMGGGKTRALEELRWLLLTTGDRDTLPIAVTFNNFTSFDSDQERSFGKGPVEAAVLSVVARVFFALYDIPKFETLLRALANVFEGRRVECSRLLGEVLELAVEAVNEQRRKSDGDPLVSNVVLMVDEGCRLVECLSKRFGEDVEDRVGQALRRAVLEYQPSRVGQGENVGEGEDEGEGNEFQPNATGMALILSSLRSTLVDKASSGRPIVALPLPESLPPTEVLTQWWKFKPEEHIALSYLAAVVCSLPRAAEFTLEEVQKQQVEMGQLSKRQLSTVWATVAEGLSGLHGQGNVSLYEWYCAVFGKMVRVVDVALPILESVFVNAPKDFKADTAIVPKLSAASLYRATVRDRKGLTERVRAVTNNVLAFGDNEGKGELLERCLREWLAVRLESATGRNKSNSPTTMSIEELLAVEEWKIDNSCPFLKEDVWVDAPNPNDELAKRDSHENAARFCKVACKSISKSVPTLFRLHKQEAFDAMVALPLGSGDKVFVLLFECKSAAEQGKQEGEDEDSEKQDQTNAMPSGHNGVPGSQAKHVHDNIVKWCRDNRQSCKKGSVAEAFADGRWAMVYFTTHSRRKHIVVGRVTDNLEGRIVGRVGPGYNDVCVMRLRRGGKAREAAEENDKNDDDEEEEEDEEEDEEDDEEEEEDEEEDEEDEKVGWVLRLGRAPLEGFFGPLFDLYACGRAAAGSEEGNGQSAR